MATFSNLGADWMAQRIGCAMNGVLGATLFFVLDWILPRWLKIMYVMYEYYCRARSMEALHKAQGYTIKFRVKCLAIPTVSLAIFRFLVVQSGREIMYHHGFVGYGLILGGRIMAFLTSDGPPDDTGLQLLIQRDASICYFSTAYCLVHLWWFWHLFCSAIIWTALPAACLSFVIWISWKFGIWIPWNKLPESLRKIPFVLFVGFVTLFMQAWDLYDKIEAHLTERFTKWLQYRLHRLQQSWRKSNPSYVYEALQPGEIRLLRLKRTCWWLPGSIEAELIHVMMTPPPDYEAVSYRWGSSDRTELIVLNGANFAVTKSAYNLLMARRTVWQSRTIWIDAICINQSDDEEKAAQVKLMKEIYHYAHRVVIFLGGDWTARLAAPLLFETLAATYQFDDPEFTLNKLTIRERSTIKWKALKELILNDYFTRAWIVQEVAVGQTVMLYHGGLYISWGVFFQVAMHLAHPHRRNMLTIGDRKDRAFYGTSSLENIAFMNFLRPDSVSEFGHDSAGNVAQRTSLDAILFATFTFRAMDPRDKVFAVLGVAKYDDREGLLLPDYSKSVCQVYRDTAEHLFFHSDIPNIHMLALAGIGHSSERLAIPSWVPNLNQEHLWFPHTDFINQTGSFRASGDWGSEFSKAEIADSLSVRGIMHDTIAIMGITTVYEGELRPSGQQDAVYVTREKPTIVKDITGCIEKHKTMWPEKAHMFHEAFWLALVAGRINRKQPSEDRNWSNVFHHWVSVMQKLDGGEYLRDCDAQAVREGADKEISEFEEGDVISYDSAIEGCYGRRFAITEQGRLCWVPPYSEKGDVVFVPLGAQTPFLMRAKGKIEGQDVFELVGESYVQGIMWGELMHSEYQESTITVV